MEIYGDIIFVLGVLAVLVALFLRIKEEIGWVGLEKSEVVEIYVDMVSLIVRLNRNTMTQ